MSDLAEHKLQELNLLRSLSGEVDAHFFMDQHPKKGMWAGALFFTQPGEELPAEMLTAEFMDSISPTVDYMGVLDGDAVYEALEHTRSVIADLALSQMITDESAG